MKDMFLFYISYFFLQYIPIAFDLDERLLTLYYGGNRPKGDINVEHPVARLGPLDLTMLINLTTLMILITLTNSTIMKILTVLKLNRLNSL